MAYILTDAKSFKAEKAWGARDLATIEGASVRLHWTDKPYIWHTNDGAEFFFVIGGAVDMHYKNDGETVIARLNEGDMFVADIGDEHVAHPDGEARILVVERKGSI
jgi:mannose-6-phosphate isomerase-like protein (cupin superfamily)